MSSDESNYSIMELVEKHNLEMIEQSMALSIVNKISKKLLTFGINKDFGSSIEECLSLIGTNLNKSRVYIWRDETDTYGKVWCKKIYEWCEKKEIVTGNSNFREISYNQLPSFQDNICGEKCFNSLSGCFLDSEMKILSPQGAKAFMVAPISVNGKRWGFIGMDNGKKNENFKSMEENILLMSGSMLVNAIENMKIEEELKEMEQHTQLMLNATPLCCNLWTSDFYNMRCNDEAVRLFELSSQKEYLERFNELSPEYQPNGKLSSELAAENILKAFQDGYYRFEWVHQKLDGTPIPAEITLVRIKYKDSFIVAGYTRDLREEKAMLAEIKTKEALRIARDEALLDSKAKSNFLANMSHEIRTPMNAISGFAEIILRESTGRKTMQYAKGIKDACNNLINIVNDILDISKIESGKLEIFNSPYELASLLNDVIAICRMRLGSKPLMFITNIDSRLPAKLVGDEVRIRQILINMISNAIKYTNEGYISLRVSGTLEGNQANLQFSVQDSGVGIKPKDLEILFEEFERVNTTKNRSIEGTGLGLAISKKLCEMMDGHINVKSEYGTGSEFVVDIPQQCIQYEPLAKVEETKNVLLYEPRERYRLSIAETLENLECKCISCESQSQLYKKIREIPYDYIMTAAFHLNKVQEIVEKNKLQIPVVAFADYGETTSEDKVYTIIFSVNCLQLSTLMNGQKEDYSLFGKDNKKENFIAPSAHVLVVDDNAVNLQVAKGLMEPYQFTIDVAENGLKAVEMVKHTKYDLVFMDHMMPEMDGIDATAAIRQLEGEYYKTIPIIALTANALVGTKEMFIQEGMNDFLAKPIEINKLAQMLIKWLPLSKIEKGTTVKIEKSQDKISVWNIESINTEIGIDAVGGSKEKYLQILSAYYADGEQKISSLHIHILKNDISAFRTEIHALKSTSATIGAFEISSMAAKLEAAAQSNDIKFINNNLQQFISHFKRILDGIWPIIDDGIKQEPLDNSKNSGDIAYMKDVLDVLEDAVEFVHIKQIEQSLNDLNKFKWSEAITEKLKYMQECVTVFDYDGVLECVIDMKENL